MDRKQTIQIFTLGSITLIAVVIAIFIYIGDKEQTSVSKSVNTFESESDSESNKEYQKDMSINLKNHSLLSSKISIDLPVNFEIMSDEIANVKYPVGNKPAVIYTNEETTVNIAFNQTDSTVTEQELTGMKDAILQSFKGIYTDATWLRDDIIVINDKKVGVIEFISPATDIDIYNLMFMTELNGRLLISTFNATVDLMDEWKPVALKIMNSLVVNTTAPKVSDSKYTFTMDDLSFIKVETEEKVYIGMYKEEVDSILGTSTKKPYIKKTELHHYDGIQIYYRDNKVAYMSFSSEYESDIEFKTYGEVKLGNLKQKMLDVYGEYSQPGHRVNTYYLQKKGKNISLYHGARDVAFSEKELSESQYYDLAFFVDKYEGHEIIYRIMISDYQYSTQME